MRSSYTFLFLMLFSLCVSGKEVRDTVYTGQGDKIILIYDIITEGNRITISLPAAARFIPTDGLRKSCKGDIQKLKAVIFDKVGNNGAVNWIGMYPSAFMVPLGMSYNASEDGFYIFGESQPLVFTRDSNSKKNIEFPIYIAVYEKKRTYRIVEKSTLPLNVNIDTSSRSHRPESEVEKIAVKSTEEIDADNETVTKALSGIRMIRMLLETETELPFSETLKMEIFNLRALKEDITDVEVLEKINEVLLDYNQKERELKEEQKQASLYAQKREQERLEQEKKEEEARQKEAEDKIREQEEKQQKRTIWMIVGAVVLGILAFIGNAVFRHFRDIRNQKSIMQMQESIARQAQHEACRRSQEIIRNKAHQAANKGKGKLRESLKGATKTNSKRKSI